MSFKLLLAFTTIALLSLDKAAASVQLSSFKPNGAINSDCAVFKSLLEEYKLFEEMESSASSERRRQRIHEMKAATLDLLLRKGVREAATGSATLVGSAQYKIENNELEFHGATLAKTKIAVPGSSEVAGVIDLPNPGTYSASIQFTVAGLCSSPGTEVSEVSAQRLLNEILN